MPAVAMDGMRCPECGSSRLSVVQTCAGSEAIIRRRKCAEGHRFITEEKLCDPERYREWHRAHNADKYSSMKASEE